MLPTLTLLMAAGRLRHRPGRDRPSTAWSPTRLRLAPTAAPGRPEATAAIERAIDLFAAEIGMDPAEVRRRNLLPAFTETAARARAEPPTTPATTRWPWTASLTPPTTHALRRSRPCAANGVTSSKLGIGAAVYVEITGGGRKPARPGENGTVEVHPDGTVDDPDRHLAARSGTRDGVGDAGQRGTRHPDRQDHTSSGATPISFPRAAAPADRAACSKVARRCGRPHRNWSKWPAPGERTARGCRRRPRRRSRTGRTHGTWSARFRRRASPPSPRRSRCACGRFSSLRVRPTRSARTWLWWKWTSRPARPSSAG